MLTDTLIHQDTDWLDMKIGDQATLSGKLNGKLSPGANCLVVVTPAWDTIAIALPDGHMGKSIPDNSEVSIIVTRGEDGVDTYTDHITVTAEAS
jgi:hypothetical protein